MSQFSKKFGLPRQGDDPLGLQKGLPKKKGYVSHQSSQPRLNFGSSLRKLTPTGSHKPLVFPSTTSYYDSNPGTQETYSNTPKQQPLGRRENLNKTAKNNEKKDFYKSLKIDLVSAPDKENEIGDEDELELFNFQKLEEDILAGRSTGTIERITTDNDGSQLEGQTRGSSGVKNVRTFLTKEKDSLFPERMWKTYSNVSGDRNELNITPEIEDRSHLEYRSLSKTPPPLSTGNYHSYGGSLQGTQTVNTNVQRAKIDLSADNSNQKSKNRSNSVMMNRNLREQTNNINNSSQNRSNSYKKETSGNASNNALQPLKKVISNTTSPSPINGQSSSNANIPAWNRSGPSNTKERKKSTHHNYRSNSQVSQVSDKSPSYLRNNASMSSVIKEPVMNKVETSNIKVIARFRPLNKMEQDFTEKSLGADCVMFPNDKSVVTLPDSNIWTFDAVFREHSKQEEIYNFLAKETIDDVLTGYNGTIFAYGMTSSGKTYTMYGDLYDEGLQGIIPRASHHFFDHIRKLEDDVEFVIKCSMLEIYKETLYDLLNNRAHDLKIKEDPRKGIYVHGLTEISVCSTEEMMAVLEVGERSRSVAATHLNQYSSRSHTLFIVEIIQRLPNQSEKRGRLNLIDLAGSEKIGKTGAVGETLEEAKKINLSLSCLGNVIHSLTQNAEHVPFRDSKLTRILQESLGGNYKTSLIVTCSPHSFNREETISTLKFATRAKTIKTHYKVNIMNSPESMARLIEQLKGELDAAKLEIQMLKSGETPEKILEAQQNRRETDISPFKGLQTYHTEGEVRRSSSQTQLRDRKSRMSSFSGTGQMNMGFKTIIENNLQLTNTLVGSPQLLEKAQGQQNNGGETEKMTSQEGTGDTYGPFKINYELLNQNEMLELRVQTLQSEIEGLKQMNKEKDTLVDKQAKELKQLKETIADYENKFIQFDEGQQMAQIKLSRQSDITENMNVKATVLEKQVHALTDALLNCEQSIEQLLEEKSKIANQKFDELIKETLTFKDLRLTEFFSYDKTYSSLIFSLDGDKKTLEEQTKRSFSGPRAFQQDSYLSHHEGSQIPKAQAQQQASKVKGIMQVPYDIESLLNKDMYGTAIQKSTMNDQISPEMMTYLLRQQLIQCLIVNKHLERVIAAFEWKQIIIAGKGNIKAKEARMQENYVKNIEQVLEKAAISHQKLRARLNKMELDLEQYINHVDPKKMAFGTASKAKVLRPFTKDSATKQPLQKRLDNFQSPKSNKDEKRYEAYTGSHKGKGMMGGPFGTIFEEREELNCIKIDDVYRFLADIERDLSLTNGTPNTIDEAKIMLSLKTIATEKMKEFIKHLMDDHCLTGSPMVDHTQSTKADVEELRSENERLCDQMGVVQSELELEKAQNVQMKDAYMDAKKQIDHYARLVEEMELSSRNALRQENETWQKVIEELIANNKREILRKQEEVKKLHEQLASWIYKFLDLQDKKGASPTKDLSAMEAYKKRETADFQHLQQINGTLNFSGIATGSKSLTKLDSTVNSMGGTLTPPIIKKN